jgi:hypothetical protein
MKRSEVEKVLKKMAHMEDKFKLDKTLHGINKLNSLKAGMSSLKNLLSYVMVTDGNITKIYPDKQGSKIIWMVEIDHKIHKTF